MENNRQDKEAIAQALEKFYFKGIYEGNLDLLNQVFKEEALLFGDVQGKPYAKTLDQYLDGVKNRKSPQVLGTPFKSDILNIQVVNTIAVAEVKVRMYDFHYHEYLAFHQFNSEWLIVNKMITDTSK